MYPFRAPQCRIATINRVDRAGVREERGGVPVFLVRTGGFASIEKGHFHHFFISYEYSLPSVQIRWKE